MIQYCRPGFLTVRLTELAETNGLIRCKTKKNTFSSTGLYDPSSQTLINCFFYVFSFVISL